MLTVKRMYVPGINWSSLNKLADPLVHEFTANMRPPINRIKEMEVGG